VNHPILFYDGDCGLCDGSVRWCLRHDRDRVLRFAPLQGSTYAALTLPDRPSALETLVLVDAAGLHLRSDAVLRALGHIGGGWGAVAGVGRLVPRPIRDACYRFVARHRRRWFGGADQCRLPTILERSQLLP